MEMEVRIARLESDVAHLRTDVADIKADVRLLRARIDERIDRLESKFEGNGDALAVKLDRLNDGISTAKISGLLLYFALAGTMLGAMARGFGWV